MSTIWDEGKLAMIATGYKASTLYSVLPADGSGDFTVVRNSVATRVNSDLKLDEVAIHVPRLQYDSGVTCPYILTEPQRTNLLTYPVSFGNSYWTKSGATIGSDAGTKGSDQNVSTTVDDSYTTFGGASATGFAATSDGGGTHIAGTADEIVVTTSNIIRVSFTLVLNSGTAPTVALTDALGGSNLCNSKTQLSTAGVNDMYFYGSVGGTGTVEWFNSSTTTDFVVSVLSVSEVTGYASIHSDSPLNVSAFKLVESSGGTTHFIERFTTLSGAVDGTISIYAKAAERSSIVMYETKDGVGRVFNLSDGTLGGIMIGTPVASSITAMADGWYKCSITANVPVNILELQLYLADGTDASDRTYSGDGTSGAYIAFSQMEEGSYPTSFAYSIAGGEGATTTRVADLITGAGVAATYNSVEGVLYRESAALFNDAATNRYLSLSDGTVVNAVQLYYSSTTQQIVGKVIVNSVAVATLTHTVTDETAFAKCALKWKVNDFALWVDGVEEDTDVSGVSFAASTLTTMQLDDGAGNNPSLSKDREWDVFDFLTDAQLLTLTT